MDRKTVVITGIKGQFASYAADKYLDEGYRVVGLHRRCASPDFTNIEHILNNKDFVLYEADICDSSSIIETIKKFQPDIWLNAAAQSHVGSSYNQPIVTADINFMGVARTLEAIRLNKPDIKFWQASTSERYGNGSQSQNSNTAPDPISPYAVSKIAAEFLVKSYRNTYNLHASFSIIFNYESPRRSRAFVTRKITDYIGKTINIIDQNIERLVDLRDSFVSTQDAYEIALKNNIIPHLYLGNIDSKRSWSHCKDIVDGVFQQVNLNQPKDLIFGLEETHSVREFLTEAFNVVGVQDWSKIVKIDPQFFRPSDVMCLEPRCDITRQYIDWNPQYSFVDLVDEMVRYDIELNSKGQLNVRA